MLKDVLKKRWPLILVGAAALILALAAIPLIQRMTTEQFRLELEEWVERLGPWGVAALLAIQVLQIVVAVIPGEPVELVAGTMYGAWGGLAICLTGILAGSGGIFCCVRRLGRDRWERDGSLQSRMARYAFLQKDRNLDLLIFLLYLIPGTPKDILVYVCALTRISLRRFLSLSTLARIPSVITSTWAGASFAAGNLPLTLGIFLCTGAAGAAGILLHNWLLQRKNSEG